MWLGKETEEAQKKRRAISQTYNQNKHTRRVKKRDKRCGEDLAEDTSEKECLFARCAKISTREIL